MGKRGPKKGCGGRKSIYKEKFCNDLINYFSINVFDELEINHYKNGELTWIDKKRIANKLPTLIGFAKHVNVSISIIYEWLNIKSNYYKKNFSDAFNIAKALQKDFLIQAGLLGLYNPICFKFVAVNLTDMRDVKEEKINYSETRELIIDIKPEVLQEKIDLIKKVKDANIKRIDAQAMH